MSSEHPRAEDGLRIEWLDARRGFVERSGLRRPFSAVVSGGAVWVRFGGRTYRLAPDRNAAGGGSAGAGDRVVAPMPGLVARVHVAPGESVAAGQVLVTMEAMKMEHELSSPRAATVARIAAVEGAKVEAGSVLVELEEA